MNFLLKKQTNPLLDLLQIYSTTLCDIKYLLYKVEFLFCVPTSLYLAVNSKECS